MTSLAQQWAESRKQRQAELQAMFEASRTRRLQEHAEFLTDAAQNRVERAAEASCRAIGVEVLLKQFQELRLAQSAADAAERLHLDEQRRAQAALDAAERRAFVQDLQQEVATLLAQVEQQRLADFARFIQALQRRVKELSQSAQAFLAEATRARQMHAQDIQLQLETYQQQRAAAFVAFRAEMDQFRTALRESVWGEGGSPAAESVSANGHNSYRSHPDSRRLSELESLQTISFVDAPSPMPAAQSSLAVADLSQDSELTPRIRNFVERFIACSEPDVTLLQVVGNRELVRDLLAQGSKELHVDPFEILVVLRQMVNPDEVNL